MSLFAGKLYGNADFRKDKRAKTLFIDNGISKLDVLHPKPCEESRQYSQEWNERH